MIGITGTGGSGKSSLVDELVRRFLYQLPEHRIAVISVDPSKRRTGGALLGDRIRMNSIPNDRVYMRSMATRQPNLALSPGGIRCRERHEGGGVRCDPARDLRDRTGRHRDRRLRRPVGLCHDPGIRRRLATGKDRHARVRRPDRHQQGRQAGSRRRPARSAQAVPPQPNHF